MGRAGLPRRLGYPVNGGLTRQTQSPGYIGRKLTEAFP
jgi:hypothetical protein